MRSGSDYNLWTRRIRTMNKSLVELLDELLTEFWSDFPKDGDDRQRLDSAIGAYLLARSLPNGDHLASVLLHPLIFAAEDLAKIRGQSVHSELREDEHAIDICSFCGAKKAAASVAAGANARICRDCVELLHNQFETRTP